MADSESALTVYKKFVVSMPCRKVVTYTDANNYCKSKGYDGGSRSETTCSAGRKSVTYTCRVRT